MSTLISQAPINCLSVFDVVNLLENTPEINIEIRCFIDGVTPKFEYMGVIGQHQGMAGLPTSDDPPHKKTVLSLTEEMKTFSDSSEENKAINVYLLNGDVYEDDSYTVRYYALQSVSVIDGVCVFQSSASCVEGDLEEFYPYEEIEEAKTLQQYAQELKVFDPNMPLSIYVEKRLPEPFPWEPETDGEMEYYLYRQSLKFPETLEHCLFPVHKIIMRDGDCMFTHQNHLKQQGITVGEALTLLEQFKPEEYMAVNIEIDQGNQTAIPYYFNVWEIEQKDNHCVLIGNANQQAAFDTHRVDIIETKPA